MREEGGGVRGEGGSVRGCEKEGQGACGTAFNTDLGV